MKATIKFVKIESIEPGFYLLHPQDDDNGYPIRAHKTPIVGWAYEEDSLAPYPITLEGVQTDNVSILHPDGTVDRPCFQWFPSADYWLRAQQQEYAEKQGDNK